MLGWLGEAVVQCPQYALEGTTSEVKTKEQLNTDGILDILWIGVGGSVKNNQQQNPTNYCVLLASFLFWTGTYDQMGVICQELCITGCRLVMVQESAVLGTLLV